MLKFSYSHWFACGQLLFVVRSNSIINIIIMIKFCGTLADQPCRGSGFDTGWLLMVIDIVSSFLYFSREKFVDS